ncbi:hypothetical protein [Propylenella binzhouense]|uniref:Uncharacterized protein n=1 Tax=Propylenella binzhouense TaxID=2555902 RepID=A0A964WSM8_9HYPH|nr:hypothetical protein [Propylenella binzhouense]MYZ47137.1 hypothetical protein [Propylenella binzhouense]
MQSRWMAVVVAASVLAVGAAGEPRAAPRAGNTDPPQGSFDGRWSVLLETTGGGCASRRRVAVTVRAGRVSYEDYEHVTAEGRIFASGRVRVRFNYEGDRLDATGSVKAGVGAGSWVSPTENCEGSWNAQKER